MEATTTEQHRSGGHPDPLARLTVADYASNTILTCEPDAPLTEVAWLMANNRVHAVVVVDDESAEPPVISDRDLIAAADSGRFNELSVRDIAMTESVSVRRDDPMDVAAQRLAEHGVSHLIVRDERRLPAGVLSSLDIARAISGR